MNNIYIYDLIPKAKNWKINILHKKIVMELYNEDYKEIFISTINKIICKIFFIINIQNFLF